MDKVEVIGDLVYVELNSILDYLHDVSDRMSRVAEISNNLALGNQVLGIIFVAQALEKVLEAHKPLTDPAQI